MNDFNFLPLMKIMIEDAGRKELIARHVPTEIQANAEDMTMMMQQAANNNQHDKKVAVAKLFRENEKEAIRGIVPTLAVIPHVELAIVHNSFKNNTAKIVVMPRQTAFIANSNIGVKTITKKLQPEKSKTAAPVSSTPDPRKILQMSDYRQLRHSA